MKLVEGWKGALRWLSVQFSLLIIAWSLTPVDLQTAMLAVTGWPPDRITAILGLLAIIGRITDQQPKPKPEEGA